MSEIRDTRDTGWGEGSLGGFGGFSGQTWGVVVRLNGDMTTTTPTQPTATDLAAAAKPSRNRAVDAYRGAAMVAVALGHWAAIAAASDGLGSVSAGNALEHAPGMAWMTWFLQVMPLFFVVGGYASAMSLDAHCRDGSGRPRDWIAGRMRRMLAPTVVLAGTWLVVMTAGVAVGVGGLIGLGATAAAIPLWFLANYTIDTAFAPYLLPRFRRRPMIVVGGLLGTFATVELIRYTEPALIDGFVRTVVLNINWVIGWLLFQVAGFAWRDGLLPTGGRLAAIAGGAWAAAIAAVAIGPWPVAMVHFPGLENSPTHPPSTALLLFGIAYSATAVAAAPAVSDWLARHARVWTAVVVANSMAMSIYLWHMTAAIVAVLIAWAAGLLPTAAVGTAAWWVQKLPLMGIAAVVLTGIVAVVGRYERMSLLARPKPWSGSAVSMLALAAVVSAGLKVWTNGTPIGAAIGAAVVLVAWKELR